MSTGGLSFGPFGGITVGRGTSATNYMLGQQKQSIYSSLVWYVFILATIVLLAVSITQMLNAAKKRLSGDSFLALCPHTLTPGGRDVAPLCSVAEHSIGGQVYGVPEKTCDANGKPLQGVQPPKLTVSATCPAGFTKEYKADGFLPYSCPDSSKPCGRRDADGRINECVAAVQGCVKDWVSKDVFDEMKMGTSIFYFAIGLVSGFFLGIAGSVYQEAWFTVAIVIMMVAVVFGTVGGTFLIEETAKDQAKQALLSNPRDLAIDVAEEE